MSAFQIDIAGERVVADGYEVKDCLGCLLRAFSVEETSFCAFYGADIKNRYLHVGKRPPFCKVKHLYIVLGE